MSWREPADDEVPTIGQLAAQGPKWFWLVCNNLQCNRRVPLMFEPFVARYGAGTSSNMLRRNSVCTGCGRRGAAIQVVAWEHTLQGYPPFPGEAH